MLATICVFARKFRTHNFNENFEHFLKQQILNRNTFMSGKQCQKIDIMYDLEQS